MKCIFCNNEMHNNYCSNCNVMWHGDYLQILFNSVPKHVRESLLTVSEILRTKPSAVLSANELFTTDFDASGVLFVYKGRDEQAHGTAQFQSKSYLMNQRLNTDNYPYLLAYESYVVYGFRYLLANEMIRNKRVKPLTIMKDSHSLVTRYLSTVFACAQLYPELSRDVVRMCTPSAYGKLHHMYLNHPTDAQLVFGFLTNNMASMQSPAIPNPAGVEERLEQFTHDWDKLQQSMIKPYVASNLDLQLFGDDCLLDITQPDLINKEILEVFKDNGRYCISKWKLREYLINLLYPNYKQQLMKVVPKTGSSVQNFLAAYYG